MALLWRIRVGGIKHRYCHAGEQHKEMVGGHPVRAHPDDSDAALLRGGWTTDGRCWFCPTCSKTLAWLKKAATRVKGARKKCSTS